MAALAAAGASGGGVGALFGVWDVVQAALCLATAALVRRVDEAEIARAKRAAVEAQREADAATSRLKQLDGASTADGARNTDDLDAREAALNARELAIAQREAAAKGGAEAPAPEMELRNANAASGEAKTPPQRSSSSDASASPPASSAADIKVLQDELCAVKEQLNLKRNQQKETQAALDAMRRELASLRVEAQRLQNDASLAPRWEDVSTLREESQQLRVELAAAHLDRDTLAARIAELEESAVRASASAASPPPKGMPRSAPGGDGAKMSAAPAPQVKFGNPAPSAKGNPSPTEPPNSAQAHDVIRLRAENALLKDTLAERERACSDENLRVRRETAEILKGAEARMRGEVAELQAKLNLACLAAAQREAEAVSREADATAKVPKPLNLKEKAKRIWKRELVESQRERAAIARERAAEARERAAIENAAAASRAAAEEMRKLVVESRKKFEDREREAQRLLSERRKSGEATPEDEMAALRREASIARHAWSQAEALAKAEAETRRNVERALDSQRARVDKLISESEQAVAGTGQSVSPSDAMDVRKLMVEQVVTEARIAIEYVRQNETVAEARKKAVKELRHRYHPDRNKVMRWLFEEVSKVVNAETESLMW